MVNKIRNLKKLIARYPVKTVILVIAAVFLVVQYIYGGLSSAIPGFAAFVIGAYLGKITSRGG